MNRAGYTRRGVLRKGAVTTGALLVGGTAASWTAAADIGDGRVADFHMNNIHMNPDKDVKLKNYVHDSSPHRNAGTWMGDGDDDPVVKDGAVGNAFEFGAGDFVQIDEDDSLALSSAVTLAAWVKRDGEKRLEYIYDGRGHNYLLKEEDGSEKPAFYVRIGGSWKKVVASDPLPDQTWTHVAGTYDSSDGSLQLYVDGALDKSAAVSGQIETSQTSTGIWKSRIGDTVWEVTDPGNSGGYSFQGMIDEVRVYNRAISGDEVEDLYLMRDV